MKLAGKVAIITGGGRGLGRAIALRFAEEGAAVALTGTGREHLEATAREIVAAGGRSLAVVADVAKEPDVVRMVAATIAEFGGLDILVNNAGIAGPTASVAEAKCEDWERTLAVNLTGAFLCSKHAIPHLIAQKGGRILNITSVAGLIGYAMRSPYAASKWGMIGLTRSLALEVGAHGITVNAIAPGSVRGERIANVVRDRATSLGKSTAEIEREFYVEPTALKRMLDPEEIAATAVFLCSDDARGITGETLGVTAGFRL
ncbi:MAG TPA: SDR family NAD(P)-dependent oxidoreductase [Candidatus Saccharimonadaceae bacterium]|jgi:NAD(P)-dependent dehydrogenase (short-subunit alcohol dehydrogenase family)|nr:SDR family NAD(P)-dependent oxidoreductase [Candidatus Saccharimonadaceae bacterium]